MTKRTRLLEAASAAFLLALAILLVPHGAIFHPVHASSLTVHLVAFAGSGWNGTTIPNPTITVQQGDSVTIIWSNGDTGGYGGVPHQFLLDIDKDGLDTSDCLPTADPCTGMSTSGGTVTFTANTAGSFTYYCTVHPTTMLGNFIVQGPDFSMAPSPSSLAIAPGSSRASTITVSSERGFSGTINLTPTVAPAGPGVAVNPTSVTVSPGSPAMSTLTISTTLSTPLGTYTVTVSGASSSTTNMTTVIATVIIPAFSMSSSPSSLSVIAGSASNTTIITLTSLNGFSGRVNLTATASQQGLITAFNPTFVTLSSGSSGTSTMTVSTSTTPPGFYTVTVHGTGVSATNTTTVGVSVTIPDFSINPSLPVLSVAQGSTATSTITLTSLSGFKSTLTLTGTVSPSGLTVSFSPASVSLPSGGSATSTMTVSTTGGTYRVATGSYAVTVTVTNGTLTHSTTVPVEVTSLPSNLPLTLLIGASVAIIAAAGITIYLVRRRLGGTKQSAPQA